MSSNFYCAGCNGSFRLTFTSTSVGTASGVFGVGMDIISNSPSTSPYTAFVTFGDNSTQDFLLPGDGTFWGITDSTLIKSIHIALSNNGTQGGYFVIDNLTIGASAVPEPASGVLVLAGIAGWVLKRKIALPRRAVYRTRGC